MALIEKAVIITTKRGRKGKGKFEYDYQAGINQLANEGLFACQLTILTPYHATRLFREMQDVIDEKDLSKFDLYHLVWKHPKIARDEMRDLLAWAQHQVNDPTRVAAMVREDMKRKMRRDMAMRTGAGAATAAAPPAN